MWAWFFYATVWISCYWRKPAGLWKADKFEIALLFVPVQENQDRPIPWTFGTEILYVSPVDQARDAPVVAPIGAEVRSRSVPPKGQARQNRQAIRGRFASRLEAGIVRPASTGSRRVEGPPVRTGHGRGMGRGKLQCRQIRGARACFGHAVNADLNADLMFRHG
ncbi:hypothetical protein SL003B_2548 [Polymorphum gilvum SL003B-26A1]|uniref:Uncharacterized protein n=1 Tax=Polymorphum gilvum (strain LMG 25793 / CGMCC 1.9160 / SL003B-26A1) TaxID=991905 RepID=F2J3E7_POLGS|nr:hypothetical protein SL003B_2548 [Polymorphum gilvum SL003B-26A1]